LQPIGIQVLQVPENLRCVQSNETPNFTGIWQPIDIKVSDYRLLWISGLKCREIRHQIIQEFI